MRHPANERWRPWCLIVLAALCWAACTPEAPDSAAPESLETVDVAPGATLTPEEDPRAAPRRGQLAGVLPDDFPSDLPLHLPASVDGFGASSDGRTVDLTTSSAPERVRAELARALAARGWQGEVALGASTLAKDGRNVRLVIEAGRFGSRYSYRY